MTIDERLEALTQTVELLSHMVQEHDKTLTRLENLIQPLMHIALDHEARLRKVEGEEPE